MGSQKRPHPRECGSKDLTGIVLRARQDLGRAFQVKRTAGAQALGRNQPEVWGTSKKACVTAEERGDAKWKMRPKRRQALMAFVQWLRLWD